MESSTPRASASWSFLLLKRPHVAALPEASPKEHSCRFLVLDTHPEAFSSSEVSSS